MKKIFFSFYNGLALPGFRCRPFEARLIFAALQNTSLVTGASICGNKYIFSFWSNIP